MTAGTSTGTGPSRAVAVGVTLDDVSVRFPDREAPALTGVSLRVRPGEQVAVLGASGCGKTTLLRSIVGAVPTTGTVRVDDLDPADPRQRQRIRHGVGVLRQGTDLVPQLAARTNAVLGVTHRFGPADWLAVTLGRTPARWRERLDAVARRHRVDHCLEAVTSTLSGGERQRVALVRAVLGAPSMVLADEPTTGLDPVAAVRAVDHLLDTDGATLLVTTHDLEVAARFPRKIGVRDGRVIFDQDVVGPAEVEALYGGRG